MTSKPTLSRRSLLLSGVALGGLAVLPVSAQSAGFGHLTALAIPPLDHGVMEGDVRVFNLGLQDGTTEFFKGYHTPTMGINGSYLGPVLRMRKGEKTRLNVSNGLGVNSTLHWHGFNLPATADGGPHQNIRPGDTWSPEFEIVEQASTMWYHSHALHKTAEQVWAGLAGMVIIDDENADALDIPSEYGVDDIPVVLQDRRFQLSGTMPYNPRRHDMMAGMHGNYPVINGVISPYLEITTEKVRLRLLNGSNASIYNLQFRDGRTFQMIASDGGLLAAPVTLNGLRLAPGERAEIVVGFTPGEPALLESIASEGGNRGGGMMGNMAGEQSPVFDLLEFRPAAELSASPDVPATLADLAAPDATAAVQTRQFLLEMGGMGRGGGFTINGAEMDMTRIDHVVKMGEAEVWEIANAGPMAHPFHVHNTQFRILDKGGRATPPHEAGRKDTVLVEPGEVVRILIRFDHYADATLPYMYHCHILEHEDAGMMGQFTVV